MYVTLLLHCTKIIQSKQYISLRSGRRRANSYLYQIDGFIGFVISAKITNNQCAQEKIKKKL